MTREEYAKLERQFEERLASGYYTRPAKPKPTPIVSVPVSDGFAQRVAARPQNVRVFVRDDDGTTAVERPKANPHNVTVRVDWVREVDAQGRPVWDRGGVVHEYDPLAALRRD
jgi:hypothetical protein